MCNSENTKPKLKSEQLSSGGTIVAAHEVTLALAHQLEALTGSGGTPPRHPDGRNGIHRERIRYADGATEYLNREQSIQLPHGIETEDCCSMRISSRSKRLYPFVIYKTY